jgi:hypothetical protein
MSKPASVKAVVEYAKQLRDEADRLEAADPWASAFRPTEAAARRMSARRGPEAAIDPLRRRAAKHKRQHREDEQTASVSLGKHKNRQQHYREKLEKERGHLSPGARIDGAIARLSLVASPAGAQIGQSVHGGTPDHTPAFCVDAADKARRLALLCARQVEALEDELRVRDVSKAA